MVSYIWLFLILIGIGFSALTGNLDTINEVYDIGIRDIVVGSYIFLNKDISNNISRLIDKIR